jgi:hypothetical protein
MDEVTLQRRKTFGRLKTDLNAMVREVGVFAAKDHRQLQYQRLSAE